MTGSVLPSPDRPQVCATPTAESDHEYTCFRSSMGMRHRLSFDLLRADTGALAFRLAPSADARRGFGEEQVWHDRRLHTFADSKPGVAPCSSRGPASSAARSVWGV